MGNIEPSSAQEFLLDHELIGQRSDVRVRALACLACRWAKSGEEDNAPRAHGYEIIKCAGIRSGTLYPMFEQLRRAGVVESEREDFTEDTHGRPLRNYFIPASTELGKKFVEKMDIPTNCSLD